MTPNIILQNPFRFFGVCSNAPTAERLANSNRLNAYLKVNKEVVFPLDLLHLMPPLSRSADEIGTVTNNINLPHDQLKYALFWFINASSIDKMALDYLQNGNTEKAAELFAKRETFSSLINQGVLAFIQSETGTAIQHITKVIHNATYRSAFVETICGAHFSIEEDALAHLFMDALLVEYPVSDLADWFQQYGESADDDAYLKEKSVGEPMAAIHTAIATAKTADKKDAQAQYQAGLVLMNETKAPLQTIRSILGVSDMQYQMTADNLAKQILQCGINYYNNTDEEDDRSIDKAYTLQHYALSIAVGKLTKDRCRDNVDILERKKQELPPKEVQYYDRFIKDALTKYAIQPDEIKYAIELIQTVIPYLMSIKEVLGERNAYYLKISTLIVNASLHNVIEEFNVQMKDINVQLRSNRIATISRVQTVFTQAWTATLYMDQLDMESTFKNERYLPQRNILKSQVDGVIDTDSYLFVLASLNMRGETKLFNECRTISDCNNYLRLFPNGKYTLQVKRKLEDFEFAACKTERDCQNFQRKYPYSKHPIDDRLETCCYEQCKSASDYRNYLAKYPKGRYTSEAQICMDDEDLWEQCQSTKDRKQYKHYLALFPNGRHKIEAEQYLSNTLMFNTIREYVIAHKKWFIIIPILLITLIVVGVIGGLRGFCGLFGIIGVISGICTFAALNSENGCRTSTICCIIACVAIFLAIVMNDYAEQNEKEKAERIDFAELHNHPTINKCQSFLSKYQNSSHKNEVLHIYFSCAEAGGIGTLYQFADNHKTTDWGRRAFERVYQMRDSLYQIADSLNTIQAWKEYQSQVPNSSYYADSDEKIAAIEEQEWNTETKAWNKAMQINTLNAYQKYLDLYPHGAHHSTADKKVIDLQVDNVYAEEHGELPSMDRTSYGGGSTSRISITNSTSYTLTLLYSGPDSKKIIIAPYKTGHTTLPNGTYRVAASVDAYRVQKYAGSETLNGGSYSAEYYIVTSKY